MGFLAGLLITASFAAAQERVGELRGADTEKVRQRMETLNLWELGFGGANGDNMNLQHSLYAFNLARHWETSVTSEIRATGHLSSSFEGAFSSVTVGGAYIPFTTDVSPIVGSDLGFGYAAIDKRPDQTGFVWGLFGGARLFRTAKAQMSLEAYYRTILKGVGNAQVMGVTVGALF